MTVDDTSRYLLFIFANLRETKDFSCEFRLDGDIANGKVDSLLFFLKLAHLRKNSCRVAISAKCCA